MKVKKWIKVLRDEKDIKRGFNLCPVCKGDTLKLGYTNHDEIIQEKCSNCCFVYDFEKGKRIK